MAVIALAINKVHEIPVSSPVFWRHQSIEVRADKATNAINRRVHARALLRLRALLLLTLCARDAHHAPTVRKLNIRAGLERHPLDCVVRVMSEALMKTHECSPLYVLSTLCFISGRSHNDASLAGAVVCS